MASFHLVNCQIFAGGYDFTGDSNSLSVNAEVEDLDSTTFGTDGWRSRKGGLKTASADIEGFWDSAPDAEVFSTLGSSEDAVTLTPGSTEGDRAFVFQGRKFTYESFGSVGELAPFSLSIMGSQGAAGLVRGRLAAAKQDVSATGQAGSILNLGQVAADEFLYATVHVFSVGTSITIDLESDDSSGFASPTTQATIGPLSATGGTWMTRVAGAITDTHYRFNVTAITGTFSVAGAVAIQ